MGFADLHIHSIHSYDGTSSVSGILKYVSDQTDLNVIAITDHDTISGVSEAVMLAPRYGLEVIPGCEITTADGHLVALFIHKPVPAGLSLVQTVLKVGEQGGICIAPHPTAQGTHSLTFETIQNALLQSGINGVLTGIEAFNGGLVYTRGNEVVETRAQALPLAQVGSSDAHILRMIGQGATEFPGRHAFELRAALISRSTQTRKGKGMDGLDIIRSYLPRFVLRKLGWVAHNSRPDLPLTFSRISRTLKASPSLIQANPE